MTVLTETAIRFFISRLDVEQENNDRLVLALDLDLEGRGGMAARSFQVDRYPQIRNKPTHPLYLDPHKHFYLPAQLWTD